MINHDAEGEQAVFVDVLTAAEDLVKDHFRHHDPSHDWHHVHRVRLMALNLTRCASLAQQKAEASYMAHTSGEASPMDAPHTPCDLLVVELAALFHDLCDAKYAEKTRVDDAKSATSSARAVLASFFAPFIVAGHVTQAQVELVYKIVDNVSWSKEEARRKRMEQARAMEGSDGSQADLAQQEWERFCAEFQCVSDADRLDSIGSIGIMRVSAYSAAKNRPLYIPPNNAANDPVPPAEQATGYNGSAVAHFYEKLLRIRGDRLHTDMARKEAERRQAMMTSFLAELDFEWTVADQGAQLALFD